MTWVKRAFVSSNPKEGLMDGYTRQATFDEAGWTFELMIPNTADNNEAVIVATRGDERQERKVRLDYEPWFGVDVSDMARIEEETEEMVKELAES